MKPQERGHLKKPAFSYTFLGYTVISCDKFHNSLKFQPEYSIISIHFNFSDNIQYFVINLILKHNLDASNVKL
jgi:hypothetical protein